MRDTLSAQQNPHGDSSAGNNDPDEGSSRRWWHYFWPPLTQQKSDDAEAEAAIAEIFSSDSDEMPNAAGERAMLLNLLKMRNLRVDDVMTPRADIVSISDDLSYNKAMEAFRSAGHSRLPVYHESLDEPLGFVHIKDIAFVSDGNGNEKFKLNDHIRPSLFVPPSMPINALLQRMQATRVHISLVIDEYGGVDGLVTIEDLVEQIVGEIEDEHDTAEGPMWLLESTGSILAESRADIEDFEEEFGYKLLTDEWEEEVDTLGGLVFMICGRIPERGEVIPHPDGHEFEITDADPRRIKSLRIRFNDSNTDAG